MAEAENRVRRMVVQKLDSLGQAGVTQLPKKRARPRPPEAPDSEPVAEEDRSTGEVAEERTGSENRPPAYTSLEVVRDEVVACTRCEELAGTRTQTVFGVGNPQARLCFLGEAPGADEDRQGEPFVGRAGKQLTDIIEKGMRLQREDVYILNVLKCRPPGNRNPLPAEAANCREFLDQQLALILPEFICCLGAVAAQNLLDVATTIGRLRGQFHDYQGIRVLCTYHPAYLLRNPPMKKEVWEDIKILMGAMGMEVE